MEDKATKSSAAMKVDSNVTIKTLDENNRVIRTANIHNKATMHMVTGLLRFLSGAFNPVITNNKVEYTTPEAIHGYIPVTLHLGTVGVKMADRASNKPRLTGINQSEFKLPTFDDYQLQNDITPYYDAVTENGVNHGINFKFDTVAITSFDDPNNSMGLLLQVKLPAGRTIGVGVGDDRKYFLDNIKEIGPGRGWVYYNNFKETYEAIYTELGLFSDTGALLARVLLNGETTVTSDGEVVYDDDTSDLNPITQSDKTSLVVEWRIGLISLGQNDYVISETNTIPQPNPDDPSAISVRNTFRKCIDGNITTIYVPDGTPNIRDYGFYKLTGAKTLVLPKELGKYFDADPENGTYVIGAYAFDEVPLIKVYYKGSIEDWKTNIADKIAEEGNSALLRFTHPEQVENIFSGDGKTFIFTLSGAPYNITSVIVDGNLLTEDQYSYYLSDYHEYNIKLKVIPAKQTDNVIVNYEVNDIDYDYAEQQEV